MRIPTSYRSHARRQGTKEKDERSGGDPGGRGGGTVAVECTVEERPAQAMAICPLQPPIQICLVFPAFTHPALPPATCADDSFIVHALEQRALNARAFCPASRASGRTIAHSQRVISAMVESQVRRHLGRDRATPAPYIATPARYGGDSLALRQPSADQTPCFMLTSASLTSDNVSNCPTYHARRCQMSRVIACPPATIGGLPSVPSWRQARPL